jgi:hypothetical protein
MNGSLPRTRVVLVLAGLATWVLSIAACENHDATPPAAAPVTAQGVPPPGFSPVAQGQLQQPFPAAPPPASYPPPPPAPPPPVAPASPPPAAPAPAYTAPPVATQAAPPPPAASVPTATMSAPGLLALPCQTDAICGLHHCNTQYGKCAFPCQTGADCITKNCVMGVCLPIVGP